MGRASPSGFVMKPHANNHMNNHDEARKDARGQDHKGIRG